MNDMTMQFLEEQFEFVSLIKNGENNKNKLCLVRNIETKELLVKKTLNTSDEIYRIIKQLNSPYFPKIYYIFSQNNETVIIEEYIQGDIVTTDIFAKLPYKIQLKLMIQLCNAIEILHNNKIIHRDLKPSNIIITETQNIKLIDFDAARLKNDISDSDTRSLGTQGYAPPEQYGFSQTDERSDIYALGQFMAAAFGDNIPHSIKKIISKCTEFDPQHRFKSIAEVKKSLNNAKVSIKNVLLKASVLFAIVIICAGSGFIYWQKNESALPTNGIAIDINTVPYDFNEFVNSGLIFMSANECKEQYRTDEAVWLKNGNISPDEFGIYNIVPSEKFLDINTSKTKAVYEIINNTHEPMRNIEIFVSIHDASVCSNGDIEQFTKTHSDTLTCDKPIYQSIGTGEILPNETKQIIINPHYSKMYSQYACLSVCIAKDGNFGYADMITLISLLFE